MWNRIGDDIQDQIIEMALEATDLSPRELAVRFTDEKRYFVSEATVYQLLKAHDLITSPYVVIKAVDQFHTRTTRPNEMWQTDFTYFGRAQSIIKQRERIKRQTIEHRRLQHRKLAA